MAEHKNDATNQKVVLIADDDRSLVSAMAVRCRLLGMRVIQAFDAREALLAVLENRPDLICLDVNMPAGDGLMVCEVLAKDDEASRIPVIILTGRDDYPTKRRCAELCAYYLRKNESIWPRLQPIIEELVDIHPSNTQSTKTP